MVLLKALYIFYFLKAFTNTSRSTLQKHFFNKLHPKALKLSAAPTSSY